MHLSPGSFSRGTSPNKASYRSQELQLWDKTILGEKDIVSSENEKAVWQQLSEICRVAARRAEAGLDRLKHACQGRDLLDWRGYAVEAIRTLWLEEKRVATAVMQSIESGQTVD